MKTNQKVNVALDLHAGPKQEKGITGKLFLELTYHGIPEPPPRTPSSEVSAKVGQAFSLLLSLPCFPLL